MCRRAQAIALRTKCTTVYFAAFRSQKDGLSLLMVLCRHLPLPQADTKSKQQQENAIENLLQELDIDLLVLAR